MSDNDLPNDQPTESETPVTSNSLPDTLPSSLTLIDDDEQLDEILDPQNKESTYVEERTNATSGPEQFGRPESHCNPRLQDAGYNTKYPI